MPQTKKNHKSKKNKNKNKYRYRLKNNETYKNNETRKNKNKNTLKKVNCSPQIKKNPYTCYTDENLHKMRNIWNARHPDNPIYTNDSKEIWGKLKYLYNKTCDKESCWISKMTKGTKLEKELLDSFAPKSPSEWKKNPNEWLTSVDIIEVMNQYEKTYKCFKFLGPSPIDFDKKLLYGNCVWDELCNFDLSKQISNKKSKIGIIFNTDPHNKSGEHWISLFINIKKGKIFFFDSAGNEIPKEIKQFVNRVISQGAKLKNPISFTFDQNYPVEHQYKNTECGIYSIFFIAHMLQDKITGEYLKTHILKDEYIEKFRKIYYNEEL